MIFCVTPNKKVQRWQTAWSLWTIHITKAWYYTPWIFLTKQSQNGMCCMACDIVLFQTTCFLHPYLHLRAKWHTIQWLFVGTMIFRQLLVDFHSFRWDNFVCWHIHQAQNEPHHWRKIYAEKESIVRAPNQRAWSFSVNWIL